MSIFLKNSSSQPEGAQNPAFYRRKKDILLLALSYPISYPLWKLFGKGEKRPGKRFVTIFHCYQIGDLYMSLPALHALEKYIPLKIIVPKHQVPILKDKGFSTITGPPSIGSLKQGKIFSALIHTWKLRSQTGVWGLDFMGDPRAGFLMKLSGIKTCISYRSHFFDLKLTISHKKYHQAERNMEVARAFLRKKISRNLPETNFVSSLPSHPQLMDPHAPLIISCLTSKPEKNWPLQYWSELLEFLLSKNETPILIHPPDADEQYLYWEKSWEKTLEIFRGDLGEIEKKVLQAKGVISTDSFMGHLAAYWNKPVFWINGSSDPEFVAPVRNAKILQLDPMPCRPCLHRCTQEKKLMCLKDLTPEIAIPSLNSWLKTFYY